MAVPRSKTVQQREMLHSEIYRRYVSGQNQVRIAAELGMNQSSVSYHLKRARTAVSLEIEQRKADRLSALELIRAEAWASWLEGPRTPAYAAFVTQIQRSIEQERSLLGLDCAKRLKAEVAFDELPHDTKDFILGEPKQP